MINRLCFQYLLFVIVFLNITLLCFRNISWCVFCLNSRLDWTYMPGQLLEVNAFKWVYSFSLLISLIIIILPSHISFLFMLDIQSSIQVKNHIVIMPDATADAALDAVLASAFGAAGKQRIMAPNVAVFVGDSTQWFDFCFNHLFADSLWAVHLKTVENKKSRKRKKLRNWLFAIDDGDLKNIWNCVTFSLF